MGFVLLELAEGALGSSEQKVLCVFSVTGALASALRSRMRRQEGKGDQEDQLYTACRIQYHLTDKETHFFIPYISCHSTRPIHRMVEQSSLAVVCRPHEATKAT